MIPSPLFIINALLLALGSGVCLAAAVTTPAQLLYLLAASSLLVAGWLLYRGNAAIIWALAVVFCLLGMIRWADVRDVASDDISGYIGQTVQVSGTVADLPRVKAASDDSGGDRYVSYTVTVSQTLTGSGQMRESSGRCLISVRQPPTVPVADYGDYITVTGVVKALHSYQNPGLIDHTAQLKRRGITARVYAGKNKLLIRKDKSFSAVRLANDWRLSVKNRMEKSMTPEDAAALMALLFGGYEGIKPDLLAAFTATGLIHIMSVSGSHISLLAGTVQALARGLRLGSGITVVLLIIIVSAYALLAGLSAPVVRSAAMGLLSFIAVSIGRERDARYLLSLVAMMMLLAEPRLLFDISFQLSFLATAGLVYIAPPVGNMLDKVPRWLSANIAVTVAAQISVLPVIAWYFQSVSVISLVANAAAVPVIEIMIILGLTAAVVGSVLPAAAPVLLVGCNLLLALAQYIVRALAAVPGGRLTVPSGSIAFWSIYYIILVGAVFRSDRLNKMAKKLQTAGCGKLRRCLAAAVCVIGVAVAVAQSRVPALEVHFIDVGQGDAALLITPRGRAVLIDSGGVGEWQRGGFDIGARVVVPYLRYHGVSELDYLILTHAHGDHAGGAFAVCDNLAVNNILIGRENRWEYARIMKTDIDGAAEFIPAYNGQTFTVDAVDFTVVHADDHRGRADGNELSVVIKAVYGQTGFLFTGDLSGDGEARLLRGDTDLRCEVLKVAHHGSKTSTSDAFLDRVEPEYAVISAGFDNRFGHPSPEVLERLRSRSIGILRTDMDGAIVFSSDGRDLRVRTFAAR